MYSTLKEDLGLFIWLHRKVLFAFKSKDEYYLKILYYEEDDDINPLCVVDSFDSSCQIIQYADLETFIKSIVDLTEFSFYEEY